MNKKQILWLIAVLIFIMGCSKTAKTEESTTQTESEEYTGDPEFIPLGVLVIDGSLQEYRDGKMFWKAGIYAGDTVGWIGEQMDAVLDYNNQTRTFWRVEANGDYWIQQYFVYGPGYPGVITRDDAVLYTKPDPGAVARGGKVTLPKYTFIAVLSDDILTDDFMPIAVQLGGAKPDERWVKISDLSMDKNDIDGVKLARTASVTANPSAHKALLENAMDIIGKGQGFYNVPDSVNYDPALFELTVTDNLETLNEPEYYMTENDSVNVRDLPSVTGNVVRKIDQHTAIMITAKTKNKVTLKQDGEEITGFWLRTDDGNWVFSYYLTLYIRE